MTAFQKIVKYLAMALALFLAVSIIGGIVGALGTFLFSATDRVSEEVTSYTKFENIQNLKIQIHAAELTVKTGDAFLVESNLAYLTMEEQDGTLLLRETGKISGSTYEGAFLTVYIPADTALQRIYIKTGAGRLLADTLSAREIELELGAGQVIIDELIATRSAEIDGGAGQITVRGGAVHQLDVDMGVGELNLTAALTGSCEFDLGVGESNITVLGEKAEFAIHIEKGLGDITLDGKSVSNMKVEGSPHSLEVNGGIGAIHLDFEK